LLIGGTSFTEPLNQQKAREAQESFERAIKLHASYPDTMPNAWNNLGLLATREGRTGEAIPYFQEALKQSPDHLVALDNLGNAYRQQKQWEDARKVFERALKTSPQDPEANYSVGMIFAQTNDNELAYDYLQRAGFSTCEPGGVTKRLQVSKSAYALRPPSISLI
jgi:tetratricopeptide (TPR) repeat protein